MVEEYRHFEEELRILEEKLLTIARETIGMIKNSIQALKERDKVMAQEVIDYDSKIDALDLEIDEYCIRLLALYQPIAVDLRFITTMIKIDSDLERIADMAVNIAERVIEIADQPLLKPLIDIPKMAEMAENMVDNAIKAFINRDVDLARQVRENDDLIDSLRDQIYHEILGYILKDGSCAPRAIPLFMIARYLERICDHATNIAETVAFMVTGKFIKHKPWREIESVK